MERIYTTSKSRKPVNVASQRITRSNLLTLRAAEMQENNTRRMFAAICNEIQSAVGHLFSVRPEKANSMCKYYGHVIRGSWTGAFPKCDDCGCEVTSSQQLRKAMAQEAAAKTR